MGKRKVRNLWKLVFKVNSVVMSSLSIMKFVQLARPCQRLILTSERNYCYMISYHTNNLYPGTKSESRFAKFDLNKLPTKDQTFSGVIPMSEIDFNYSLGSGPGGQNVQKNKTKVDIRFHLESASWLTPDVKEILKMKYPNQLTKDGFLVVKSDRTRSRLLNQADALQKLRHFIWAAIDDVRTYLERTQIDQVEMEKQIKAQEKASRERLKAKRTKSMYKDDRKGIQY